MNRLRAWLVVVAIGASLVMEVNPGVAADPLNVGLLRPGHSVAWPGGYVDTAKTGKFATTYTLSTTDGGGRLRVALDVVQDYKNPLDKPEPHENADQRRNFTLQILQILDEKRNGFAPQEVGTGYSTESFVCFNGDPCVTSFAHGLDCSGQAAGAVCGVVAPPFNCDDQLCYLQYGMALPGGSAGVWEIRVAGEDIDGWSYRMRAMLERQPNPADIARMGERVLPNLRSRPPFELTLDCTPTVGYGAFVRRGTCGTAALGAAPGVPPGCSAQEIAESTAGNSAQEIAEFRTVEWCLRFSGGNENAGDGGLEIVPSKLTPSAEGKVYADAVQVIRARDETVLERRPAGRLVFEDSHGHWHYDGFMQYDLFAVVQVGNKLALQRRGEGLKRGWCPADEFISDWDSFNQVPRGSGPTTDPGGCFLATPNAVFGQSAGWGDIYEWPREEQFVPFGVDQTGKPKPGLYVLRETVDPGRPLKSEEPLILESDENDNSAYAYFEVDEVGLIKIIERGYGRDPWDPHRRRI